jgi:MFS family permease
MFYNRSNIGLRTSYFLATAAISGAVGGLVAYGVGFMDNVAGWRAWRWVILIVGIPTICTASIIPFVLPNSLEAAKFLTEQEKQDLRTLRATDMGQTKSAQELHKADVMEGVRDWKVYAFAVAQFCTNTMLYSFSIFLPTIIRSIGTWSTAEVQVLTIPVYVTGAVIYIITGRISDKIRRRGIFAIGGAATTIVGYCLLVPNYNTGMSFSGCFLVAAGCYTAIGTPLAWLTSNMPRYGKRAYASGVQLAVGTIGGVVAPFLFSTGTGPTYYPGYGAMIGIMLLAMLLFVVLHLFWKRQNTRRMRGEEDWKIEGMKEEEVAEMGDKSPRFMAMT